MSDFREENEALQLLHATVKNYERDAATFYANSDQATSKFTGRFDFKAFARKCFDPIEASKLGALYVGMLEESGSYMHMHKKSRVGVNGYSYSFVTVPELLLNMILAYQLPQQKFVPAEKKSSTKSGEKNEEPEGANRKKRKNSAAAKHGKNVTVNPRVQLTDEMACRLLEEMLKIPLSPESKLWKQAKYVLCPSCSAQQLAQFGEIVKKATDNGFISFTALSFFMNDCVVNRYLDNPSTILHALYIGPLHAQTVEVFTANRDDDFRNRCREVIRLALDSASDNRRFQQNEPRNISPNNPDRIRFRDFVTNVNQLVRDLNGEHQGTTNIHAGWACAAIKKFGQKRYVDKTWKDENFYDLIWTVLAQRPNLKKFVIDVLEKNFKDANAARFWRRMQPHQMSRTKISNQNVSQEDPLKPTEQFLNFPAQCTQIKFVGNDKEMRDLHALLEYKVSREDVVLVGVDAEWSAYVNPSRATILQMALLDCVYIVDLESTSITPNTYHNFLTYFFDTQQLLKIGFQFSEDLHQLRSAFRNCTALYRPNSVVCVGKLIADLMEVIGSHENGEEIKREWLPFLDLELERSTGADSSIDEGASKSNSSFSETTEEEKGAGSSSGGEKKNDEKHFFNKGLSFICEKILGRPLDKTEQCSVWDRRPLRNLQLRYAAMDAYCMLMLYEKSREVYSALGLSVVDFLNKQGSIRVSLPLLSEAPL